jgi:predicted secreted protein
MSQYGAPPPPPPPPGYGYPSQPQSPPPSNNLVWAILSIFCCWPLAIPAIVFAAQVNGKWAVGDVAGAQESAAKAKNFALWATIAGVVIYAIYFVLALVAGSLGANN